MSLIRTRKSCVLCHSTDLVKVLELPPTPLANEFPMFATLPGEEKQERFNLALQQCQDCSSVQLADVVDPERLFGGYLYVSGTSPVFVQHFKDYAESLITRLGLHSDSQILDIGSNDGTLLKAFVEQLGSNNVMGIEPAQDIADKANHEGIYTESMFFNEAQAFDVGRKHRAFDLITANNVFAHVDDLESFARGIRLLLTPDGEFVFEVSYLLDVLEKMLFDTIYHEHLFYHHVNALRTFFHLQGLYLYDVERIPSHGGSIRCYVSRANKPVTKRMLDLCDFEMEVLDQEDVFSRFAERIEVAGKTLRIKLQNFKDNGYRVCGYGAPAKLTTLMYAFDLERKWFNYIVDDAPLKQGRFTPGLEIPVVNSEIFKTESKLKEYPKDVVVVVFAWNFFHAIVDKNADIPAIWINPLTSEIRETK